VAVHQPEVARTIVDVASYAEALRSRRLWGGDTEIGLLAYCFPSLRIGVVSAGSKKVGGVERTVMQWQWHGVDDVSLLSWRLAFVGGHYRTVRAAPPSRFL